jgi:hypothetical protein
MLIQLISDIKFKGKGSKSDTNVLDSILKTVYLKEF